MPKGIKKLAKILEFIVAFIILIAAALPILLHSSEIQNYLAQAITKELSTKIKSKVTIGSIEYKLFNTVQLNNFYVEDLEQDTLLFVEHANADFSFWKLFNGKILFTEIEFDKLQGNLKVDTLGHSNLDFIIKAFEKPQKNDSSNIEYKIKNLKFKDSYISYSKQNGKATRAVNILNPDSLRFSDINAELALNILNKDTLSAEIKSLSLRERSGFALNNLRTQISGSKKGAKIQFIELLMPNTNLNITDIEFKYDSLSDLRNFAQKVKWKVPINNSNIVLQDLATIVPEFKDFKQPVSLQGLISGRLSSLRFQKMELKYGKSLVFNADLDLSGLPNIEETFIYAQINELKVDKSDLQDVISTLTKKPFILPKELNQLGTVNYKGNITGFLGNLVAYGNLNTNMGSVSTDILLKLENGLKDLTYNGTVKSNSFQLGRLLNNKQLGKIAFNINTNGTKMHDAAVRGKIKATIAELQFNKYNYRDIKFDGDYDGTGFDGEIALKDENINANFKGVIDLTQKLPVFDFDLRVQNTNLHALNLIKEYPGASLSFVGKTSMIGNSLDNINGSILFDSITFTNKDKTLNIDQIKFVSRIENEYTNFIINSDFVNGSFNGNFKYSTIGKTVNKIINYYLPSLAVKNESTRDNQNHIDVDLKIQNINDLTDVLELPYKLTGVATLKGGIDEASNKINLNGLIPSFTFNKQKIENISLNVENVKQQLKLTTRAQMLEKSGITRLYILAAAAKDSVSTQLGWQSSSKITNAGEFQATTKFRNEGGKTAAQMSILPTQIIISDSVWDIRSCKVDLNTDSTIHIHNFKFENKNQFVHIDGKLSKSQNDSVTVSMNELDLDYVMRLVKLKGISIGGIVTGKATLISLLKQPIFLANLNVKNVMINHKLMADANVTSTWDYVNKQILLNGKFFSTVTKDTVAIAKGVYIPKQDSIDVTFDARGLSVAFLDPYFSSVAQNVQGFGHGKVRMFGPMKKIGFEGNVFVDKGQASIGMLKTTYFFNDSVKLTRKTISMSNMKIYDEERNQGTLNGLITHDGLFTNMKYNVNIKGKNILAMNTHAEDNDYFFGKAYVNGTVIIRGDDKEANIIVNATSQPKTKCYIQMGGASSASDNSFINFINPRAKIDRGTEIKKPETSQFNVKVDMQIDVTPVSEMELIVDPKGGDAIRGRGNGNLRVQFDTFSDIKLYGTYIIDVGSYLFTLQTVIRKEFKIDKGSTISWTGDPFGAQVNINALYPLTASLSDLLDDVGSTTNRGNVPVNCVLKLTDGLMKPTIKFDIDLPSSDEGVKQRVKSMISTDEMMNRQIAYLLVLNKFYKLGNNTATNSGLDETLSFATSTLSAHLNNWIQKSFNTNNFSIGATWQKSQATTDEFKAQLNYQPNDRIIFNGNFGYRNEGVNTSTNGSKFIGDFDLEYLLNESGKLRAKVYSHTIDRSQLKEAKSTQGIGLIYKEDFESVSDMISYYWNALTSIGKKKTNETKTTTEK